MIFAFALTGLYLFFVLFAAAAWDAAVHPFTPVPAILLEEASENGRAV